MAMELPDLGTEKIHLKYPNYFLKQLPYFALEWANSTPTISNSALNEIGKQEAQNSVLTPSQLMTDHNLKQLVP